MTTDVPMSEPVPEGATERLKLTLAERHRVRDLEAENARLRADVERQAVLLRAINDCHRDPCRAILQADRLAGVAIIALHDAETRLAEFEAKRFAPMSRIHRAERVSESALAERDEARGRYATACERNQKAWDEIRRLRAAIATVDALCKAREESTTKVNARIAARGEVDDKTGRVVRLAATVPTASVRDALTAPQPDGGA